MHRLDQMWLWSQELVHQWAVWDPVLQFADEIEPEIYPPGFDVDELEASGVVLDEEEERELVGAGGRGEL
jgi:hypothetical protein